ncbi:MAG: aconitate hydratase AcnA [Dehalococcoidia bacterium]|nr:aconitate hydratase AcnA [Dehalococcoidia bacterium]MYD27509.1 aconitate hydratase AcnA [Dehalococcoidia bacterium]
MLDSFNSRDTLTVGGRNVAFHRLDSVLKGEAATRLPFTQRVLLENLLRREDGDAVSRDDIEALANWRPNSGDEREVAFAPARVLLQDFTGVPAVVDLASMREALESMGGDPERINPLQPVDLVIDHSVQVDAYGTDGAFAQNVSFEYERNRERYLFLRWGQQAFRNFRVVPPGTGIVHQVNLEYLASVVFENDDTGLVYPDTLVGTDSHTTMINGLGVLGWGVGGIEAEAAMLGQPVSMLIPEVVGFRLTGALPEGATGTDLVLTVTQMLRELGVVGKFVEFFGSGLSQLPLPTRATIANMAPEYGATVGFFPVDDETLAYLRFTGRDEDQVALVEAYCKEQGLFRTDDTPDPRFSATLELDMSQVEPSLAGPRRPQDRVLLRESKDAWQDALVELAGDAAGAPPVEVARNGASFEVGHGSVVIAAITSCTNTSNPEVLVGAGLLAKAAVERGLERKPWVKTSLAPGSKVVTDYLDAAGLTPYLDELGFNLVGYGCTTCIGNSGPVDPDVAAAVNQGGLVAAAVLSGNRNFEGRVNPVVRANYLASPPLVVAYALAGHMDFDPLTEPIGEDGDGNAIMLSELWPSQNAIETSMREAVRSEMFRDQYGSVFEGDPAWRTLEAPGGSRYGWDDGSTYVKNPPYFEDLAEEPGELEDIDGARVLVMVGDSVTTDHISPAGSIAPNSPAAAYLFDRDIKREDFNSYGARRGNHEVMMRGTFANIRLRNQLAPGTEGGVTRHLPDGEEMSIFDAAVAYRDEGTPLMVLAGKEYGTGSSRDWAAKGPRLLGVRAVIAESYERIHRSNLVGMGILPLQYLAGESRDTLGLSGEETFAIDGIAEGLRPGGHVTVTATDARGTTTTFEALVRIDTPVELEYYRNGGILPYVLRQLAAG